MCVNIIALEKKAFAKVNLYLKILGKRTDGYHELFTVMRAVNSMFDTVRLHIDMGKRMENADMPDINISCADENIPCDERNTAHKAARIYFLRAAKIINNRNVAAHVIDYITSVNLVNIEIEKRIPSQAGLGGGSSDAAAVLLMLNEVFSELLTESELIETAAAVGADVSFFVKTKQEENGVAFCEGIGEIVTPFIPKANMRDLKIEVIKPECNVSTKEAFGLYKELNSDFNININILEIKNIFENGSVKDIIGAMQNDFEAIIAPLCGGEIEKAKAELLRRGAATAQMTGSGSAVFGIFLPD